MGSGVFDQYAQIIKGNVKGGLSTNNSKLPQERELKEELETCWIHQPNLLWKENKTLIVTRWGKVQIKGKSLFEMRI